MNHSLTILKSAAARLPGELANVPNAFPPRMTSVPSPDDQSSGEARAIMGFFTDTTLCIGCKACEVACKQWNQLPSDGLKFSGNSYDNTGHLGATTWRHVAFKEKIAADSSADSSEGDSPPADFASRWLMMSDVCKHCENSPCQQACPTGALIYNQFGDVYLQNDICNGCGYCISACPFGVLGRADGEDQDGRAHKCTLCMDRQTADMTPACAKACPTASIQFGPVEQLRTRAEKRVEELHGRGRNEAYLYGKDSLGDYGRLNAFFLLEDHPNEYNLPEAPRHPFKGQGKRYAASLLTGLALTAAAALIFGRGSKNAR